MHTILVLLQVGLKGMILLFPLSYLHFVVKVEL
jgi:hypothetical protein